MGRCKFIFFLLLTISLHLSANTITRIELWKGNNPLAKVNKGQSGVVFSGSFAPDTSRLYWDFTCNSNFKGAYGFRLRIINHTPVVSPKITLYFRTKSGWYENTFNVVKRSGSNDYEIMKAESRAQESPSGWGEVTGVRFAVWNPGVENLKLELLDFSVLNTSQNVGVVRSLSTFNNKRSQIPFSVAEEVWKTLYNTGVKCQFFEDFDLNRTKLPGLLILPYAPQMTPMVKANLINYMNRGGRVIACFDLPEEVLANMGFAAGRFIRAADMNEKNIYFNNQSYPQEIWGIMEQKKVSKSVRRIAGWVDSANRKGPYSAIMQSPNGIWFSHVPRKLNPDTDGLLFCELISLYEPGIWNEACNYVIRRTSEELGYASVKEAYGKLATSPLYPEIRKYALAASETQDRKQRYLLIKQQALLMERAFYLRLDDASIKAAWIRDADCNWDNTSLKLYKGGYTDIFVSMIDGASAAYPSKVLSMRSEYKGRDILQECLTACHKYNIRVHVWFSCFNMHESDRATQMQFRSKGLTIRNDWLCPSNWSNRQRLLKSVDELLANYKIDGLHLDFIRFPGDGYSVSASGLKSFEILSKKKYPSWPAEAKNPTVKKEWYDFRKNIITWVVDNVHKKVKGKKPDVILSAAVFGDWISARRNISQDWVFWCQKGYLDWVVPMNYDSNADGQKGFIQKQQKWLSGSTCKLIPGIGLTSRRLSPAQFLCQIQVVANSGAPGYAVFDFNDNTAEMLKHLDLK